VVTVDLPHKLRSDALDNRERILDAARAAFVAEGMNSVAELARRAQQAGHPRTPTALKAPRHR
jgi:hypothetical protein